MIKGLQITMRGEELSRRIAERIRVHDAAVSALDARIKRREGDLSFDVRAEDDFKTVGELASERQRHQDRVSHLTLLRDSLVAGEIYVLSSADLRLAGVISADFIVAPELSEREWADRVKDAAVDGLKLTISGEELRRLLEQRRHDHEQRAERWKREQARTLEDQTDDHPLLPDHICANEAERHEWRADVLGFIRDHVESAEVYRVGEADLAFGELLPEKPGWIEQEEYEERTSVGFHLERLRRRAGTLLPSEFSFGARQSTGDDDLNR